MYNFYEDVYWGLTFYSMCLGGCREDCTATGPIDMVQVWGLRPLLTLLNVSVWWIQICNVNWKTWNEQSAQFLPAKPLPLSLWSLSSAETREHRGVETREWGACRAPCGLQSSHLATLPYLLIGANCSPTNNQTESTNKKAPWTNEIPEKGWIDGLQTLYHMLHLMDRELQ